MLAAVLVVVVLAVILGPIVVIALMHVAGGRSRSERANQTRAQELHDLALERSRGGYRRDEATWLDRELLLDQLAARFPRNRPLASAQRELYGYLTVSELEELVRL